MALKKGILYTFAVIFLISLSQDCHASILGGEVELGWPKGEYYVHFGSDPVNLKNGNLYYPVNDLSIPSVGIPLVVSRSYNSRSRYSGIFGFGWSSSLDIRAEVYEKTVAIMEADGFRDTFAFASEEGEIRRFQSASGRTFEISKSHVIMFDSRTGEKQSFDRDGRILKQTGRYGNKQTFTYNPKGHLTQVQGTAGRLLNIQTNDSGKVVQITDPIGRTILYKYDSRGNLIEVIDKGGHRTGFTYDDLHNLTAIEYPNGGKTLLTYDVTRDLIVEESGPVDRRTLYRYEIQPENPEAWSVEVIDALENVTRYDYSKNGSHLIITDALGGKVIKEACTECGGRLSAYTDARGNTTRYEYTSEKGHQITTITDPLGHKTKRFYDETAGNLLKEVAPNGATTLYSYDEEGNVIEIKDALGNSTKYRYDLRGQLARVTDKREGITKFNYDRYGNIIAQTDPMGNQTQFNYDLVGRVVKAVDPKGGATAFEYTADDYIASTKDPLGYVVRNEYNEAGLLVKASDSISVLATLSYNQKGDIIQITDALNQAIKMVHDPLGRMISLTNTRGFTWRFIYDALGREVERVDPLEGEEIRTYDSTGNLVRIEEPGGDVTLFEHDSLNRLKKNTDPLGLVTIYSYDKVGNMVQKQDDMGNISYYVYDGMDLVLEVDSMGRDRRYDYDAAGNLIAAWIPYQTKIEYQYDLNNQLIKAIYPSKGYLSFKYDAVGNLIGTKDFSGQTHHFTFDARHQLIQQRDNDEQVTIYRTDIRGNVVEVAVQDRPSTHFSYDFLDRIVERKGPGGLIETYTYDGESNLLTSSYGKGQTKTFSYDPLNRLTEVYYPDGAKASYSYDSAGNLIRWANGHSDVIADYGPTSTVRSVNYMQAGIQLKINYDKNGNLSTISLPNGKEIHYKYDSLRRLKQVSLINGPWVKLDYNELGTINSRHYSNGLSQFYEYTKYGRISSIKIGKANNDYLLERQYQYDNVGNLIAELDGNQRFTYSYDNDRLIKANLGQWGTLRLEYDKRGNRVLKEWAGRSETNEYNAMGQIVRAGSETLAWNERGNLVERKKGSNQTIFEYNGDSKLRRIKVGPEELVSYTYDALGTLYSRTTKSTSDHIVQLDGILRLIVDQKGEIKETLVYEDMDRPLFIERKEKNLFYHQDIFDNIILITDSTRVLVDQRAYSPFGVMLSGNPDFLTPAYGARPFDPLAGLYDFRFRHYSPDIGMFITPDPLEATDQYLFAKNNPLKFKDPLGLKAKDRYGSTLVLCKEELDILQKLAALKLQAQKDYDRDYRSVKNQLPKIEARLEQLRSRISFEKNILNKIIDKIWWMNFWKSTAWVSGTAALISGGIGSGLSLAQGQAIKVFGKKIAAQEFKKLVGVLGVTGSIGGTALSFSGLSGKSPDEKILLLNQALPIQLEKIINLRAEQTKLLIHQPKINAELLSLKPLKDRLNIIETAISNSSSTFMKCIEKAKCINEERKKKGLKPYSIGAPYQND